MTATRIGDILVPEIFNPYVQQQSLEKNAFWQSGIVETDPRVIPGSRAGGETVNIPFFNSLDAASDAEELSDQKSLSVDKITTAQDVSVVQALGKAFGANDLAWALSGADPMGAIASQVAGWWSTQLQKRLVAVLKGVFAASNMTGCIKDISGESGDAAIIDKYSFADAMFLQGEHAAGITAVAMRSEVYHKLYRDDLLDTVRGADGAAFQTYQGKRVIISDAIPLVSTGVYQTYLFGPGAVTFAEGTPKTPVETDRDSLAGEDILINRRHFVLHVKGVKWVGSAVISTGDDSSGHPTATELGTGTNWTRVYDPKLIRVVKFVHKIA